MGKSVFSACRFHKSFLLYLTLSSPIFISLSKQPLRVASMLINRVSRLIRNPLCVVAFLLWVMFFVFGQRFLGVGVTSLP